MKKLIIGCMLMSLSGLAVSSEFQEGVLDDLSLTQHSISDHWFVLPTEEIEKRTMGAKFTTPDTDFEPGSLRLLCTDVDIENCDKFRFARVDVPRNGSSRILVTAFDSGMLSKAETSLVLQEFVKQIRSSKYIMRTDPIEFFTGTKSTLAKTLNLGYYENPLYFATGLVSVPLGLAYDLITSPVNAKRAAVREVNGRRRVNEASKNVKDGAELVLTWTEKNDLEGNLRSAIETIKK
jgi:hypothetical protein